MFEISPRTRECLYKQFKFALHQRSHFPASVLSHAAAILSARSSNDATRADNSRSDLVCHVNALADTSNVGESLRLEHPLGKRMKIVLFVSTKSIENSNCSRLHTGPSTSHPRLSAGKC